MGPSASADAAPHSPLTPAVVSFLLHIPLKLLENCFSDIRNDTKYDLTDYHSSHQTRNDTHTHRNSVSNTRCIARPQWASSLNQKSIISLIWSPVIIGPNQTSVYHVDLINDDHNKRWLIYWLMIFSVNKNLFYDTDRWPSLTNWEDKNGFSGNHWNLCK